MLEHLFSPESVAIAGASKTPGKVGHDILANLVKSGFAGKILPINPAGGTLLGLPVFTSLLKCEGDLDQVIVAVPKSAIIATVKEAISKKARSIIMITAGFKESGAAGLALENEVVGLCKGSGTRLLGPNCLGLLNTTNHLNSSFAGDLPRPGSIAIMSQSGALCTSILDLAAGRHLGLSKLVSIGNKADINENDLLAYFAGDPETKVIVGYLEDISTGDKFVKIAEEAASLKPVVMLKSGTTEAGLKAAASHTGVMATVDTAYAAAFKRSGVVRADSFEALFDYATAFALQPLPAGNRILIITNTGGAGTIAADAVERAGMCVASPHSNTTSSLRDRLPRIASFPSPVYVLGDAPPGRYMAAIESAQSDPEVDAILVILVPQVMTYPKQTALDIASFLDGSKPVVAAFMGGEEILPSRRALSEAGLPVFDSPERAVAALRAMYQYSLWKCRPPRRVTRFRVNKRRVERIITRKQRNGLLHISEGKGKDILSAYGFRIPKGSLAANAEEAIEIAERIGYPVAMKIASPHILHKTDLGGVQLNLQDAESVEDAFDLMIMKIGKRMPDAVIEGVYVEEMAAKGLEVILGMNRDPQFGPMLMFGLGGIFVEVLKDVTFNLAPITETEAVQMLKSTRSYAMLEGKRGQKRVDIGAIASGLQRISQLTTDFPQILELDINPFIVGEFGSEPIVADVRMTLSSLQGEKI